ncbi:MAG: hypothetical protein AAF085_02330 [Planctomycetota bacterium]
MPLPQEGHFIDMRARRIVFVEEISRRFIGYLDEKAALDLLKTPDCDMMVWETGSKLRSVPTSERESVIAGVIDHVTTDYENYDLDQFKDGYCYFAMHWKQSGGKPLVVLHIQH